MSNASRITYTPSPDATPESETATLTSVYSFVLRCAEEREKATRSGDSDDAKEINGSPCGSPHGD